MLYADGGELFYSQIQKEELKLPIPKDYCRFDGKKCMDLRITFPYGTCKKTGRKNGEKSESCICVMKDRKENISKPKWCPKK